MNKICYKKTYRNYHTSEIFFKLPHLGTFTEVITLALVLHIPLLQIKTLNS